MKYFSYLFILLIFANVCFAEKKAEKPIGVDPNDVSGEVYIDPYDVDPNNMDGKAKYVDPYDLPSVIEEKPKEGSNSIMKFKGDLMAGANGYLDDANKNWQAWKQVNLKEPKPPLDWSQVGTEVGAGYVGAFGGSVVGIFSGFLVGSLYDAVSGCEQCWVGVAVNMSTLGATLGASAGVYMFGNDEKQLGSMAATYAGTILPVLIGTIAYSGSRQLGKSGFYLATMPLLAAVGFNLTRHNRIKGESSLFENFFVDDMWVSKGRDDVLAFNMSFKF